MKIETKFSIGDEAMILNGNKVVRVYVHGIEINVRNGEIYTASGATAKPGTPVIKYRVQESQINDKKAAHGPEFDAWEADSIFKDRAELAKKLGL